MTERIRSEIGRPSQVVVVGVDGSHRAVAAALWAADEAYERDIPLRLVYAIEPRAGMSSEIYAAHDVAAAEIATQGVVLAVQSSDKPVKIEIEILQGTALDVLAYQSCAAALVCVGTLSRERAANHRDTSTVAALSMRAACPVVIVRGHRSARAQYGVVLIEFEDTPDSHVVLQHGLESAAERDAVAQVVGHLPSSQTGSHAKDNSAAILNARLERHLEPWRRKYPDTHIEVHLLHGGLPKYISQQGDSIQMAVIGRGRRGGLSELLGQQQATTYPGADCTLMICGHNQQL
ncbi:universal stress protein UspA [Mycobacteroides saopaulense]|uniref:universal stress protein n=1 Tax=Mycobacteroides saopaulense TaxID=1578165 RepID=UPI0007216B42|nr:universal stress protein [Mycobacteroides saopaulense]ALR11751.1 universal stress protein UspA [Mycobacteroides saopaulense]